MRIIVLSFERSQFWTFLSFQDAGPTENVSRDSESLQEPTTASPDNSTFFKPPSCTPTKKVNWLLLNTQHRKDKSFLWWSWEWLPFKCRIWAWELKRRWFKQTEMNSLKSNSHYMILSLICQSPAQVECCRQTPLFKAWLLPIALWELLKDERGSQMCQTRIRFPAGCSTKVSKFHEWKWMCACVCVCVCVCVCACVCVCVRVCVTRTLIPWLNSPNSHFAYSGFKSP